MYKNFKIHKILLPFSWIYGSIVWLRNKCFDWGILPSEEFSIPVISVGNLAAGGTGKTPHVEFLIHLLNKQYRVAVLSRGYRRISKGFVLATDNTSVQTIGDEPFLIHLKFPNLLVAVDEKRKRGIKKLLALPLERRPQVILLDDAFQHRYVTPSLSILLTDMNRLLCKDVLLPAGKLRESAKNKIRADIIICTKCSEAFKAIDYRIIAEDLKLSSFQQIYFTHYNYKDLLPVFPDHVQNQSENIEYLKTKSYSLLLVVALADPTGMIRYLENYTTDLHTLIYPDHHYFHQRNLVEIEKQFNSISNNQKIIITSEKDAVRFINNTSVPETLKTFIYCLPVEVAFNANQEHLFTQKIEDHVKNFARNRIMA